MRQAVLRDAVIHVPMTAAQPGVMTVSPHNTRNGVMTRVGAQVAINGVDAEKESAIVLLRPTSWPGLSGRKPGLWSSGRHWPTILT